MRNITVNDISIRGMISVIPETTETTQQLGERIGIETAEKIANSTGIKNRHIAGKDICVSDLMEAGAKKLLKKLNWSPDDVEVLNVVTQTADYLLPSNAALLQKKLNLSKNVIAFDINLGCSGFIYGLFNIASIMKTSNAKKALLMVGDTTSHFTASDDRTVQPLFGDAASIIALEFDNNAQPMIFNMGTDGSGAPYLIVKDGGSRNRTPNKPLLFMDGTQVFAFTLREVPKNISQTLDGKDISTMDYVVLHQANELMLDHLAKKIGASEKQMVMALENHGNTSSASIPLAITDELGSILVKDKKTLLLSGFGVGWSWGSAIIKCSNLKVCETIIFQETS